MTPSPANGGGSVGDTGVADSERAGQTAAVATVAAPLSAVLPMDVPTLCV